MKVRLSGLVWGILMALSGLVPAKAATYGYFLKNRIKHSEAEK